MHQFPVCSICSGKTDEVDCKGSQTASTVTAGEATGHAWQTETNREN